MNKAGTEYNSNLLMPDYTGHHSISGLNKDKNTSVGELSS